MYRFAKGVPTVNLASIIFRPGLGAPVCVTSCFFLQKGKSTPYFTNKIPI